MSMAIVDRGTVCVNFRTWQTILLIEKKAFFVDSDMVVANCGVVLSVFIVPLNGTGFLHDCQK